MYLVSRLISRSPQVLATLIMFSLSAGVLGGVLFYIDSTSSNVLEEMTENILIDMEVQCSSEFYRKNETTIGEIAAIVAEQELIESTEIIAYNKGWDEDFPETRFSRYSYLGVDNSIFESFPDMFVVQAETLGLNDTTCYLEHDWANYLGLEIGDTYVAEIQAVDANYTQQKYNASFHVTGLFTTSVFGGIDSEGKPITTLRMITTRDGLIEVFGNVGLQSTQDAFYSVWTRFESSFIIHGSPSLVESSLLGVKKRIEQSTLPYARVTDFEILGIVYGYNTWASTMTIIALAFSIPSIVMGVMLIVYNNKLLEDERRRDTGNLVTRGASGWQSFNWVISSAIVTGLIGSLGAVLTGVLAAILSGGVKQLFVFSTEELATFNLLLEPASIMVIFVFSFVVGFLISLPAAVSALLMTPEEAHSIVDKQSLADREMIRTPIAEVIAIIVSGLLMTPLLSILGSGGVSPTGVVLFAGLTITMFGIFIVSTSRILSLPTSFVKYRMLNLFRSVSRAVGARMISRNAILAKRSEAMGVMFIGLVFTAGFFSAISSSTGSTHMRELFSFNVGADIVINVNENARNVTIDIVEDILAIEGVNNASSMLKTNAFVNYVQALQVQEPVMINTSIPVFAIDPLSWIHSAFLLPYFTINKKPIDAVALLTENESNVISSFMPVSQYVSGEPVYNASIALQFITPPWNFTQRCTIVDVMSSDYSSRTTSFFPGEPDTRDFVVMNIDYIHNKFNTTRVNKIYVSLSAGANYTRVIEDIRGIGNFTTEEIAASNQSIDKVLDSRTGQSIYGVYTLNLLFSLIYLTAGLMIISLVKTQRLQKQFSILRALGTQNSSIMQSVLVDTGVSMVLGILIGSIIGLSLTLLLLQIPLVFLGLNAEIVWSRLPVYLVVPAPLILGIVVLSFSSAFITTYITTRKSLRSNLADDFRLVE